MDIVAVIAGGLRVLLGFLFLLFVPGFAIMLVYFPRLPDLKIIERLVYSAVVSIGSVIVLVLFMDVALGIPTTPGNISIVLVGFSALMFVVWGGEMWYINSRLPAFLHEEFSETYQELYEYFSELFTYDRFTTTAMTSVVWHEKSRSGKNQYDHTYFIDISEEIDIQQADEKPGKAAGPDLMPPPCPRTRYFELSLREVKENGLSLVDDLQVFPVTVTRNPGFTSGELSIPGSLKIAERIFKKTDPAGVQWIYSHDFDLLAIIYSQDNPGQMVNRVLTKLDQIAVSIKSGSRITSQVEEIPKKRDDDTLLASITDIQDDEWLHE